MEQVLLVEDADTLRDVLKSILEKEGYAVDACSSAEQALELVHSKRYSCVLADFKLPGRNGIELLKATREISNNVPYVIMTAYGSIEIAVQAMKYGANDFITKPFEPELLVSVLSDIIKHKRIINRSNEHRARGQRTFISKNPEVHKILEQVKKVARVETSVLILGESGTGKELIARAIHENSPRKDKPFIAVNCAAMPAELLESEFFGHEAGSFTGATQTRVGVFELASEGTIFLDEIGDMPLPLQVKCLRALQEREIKRVGGNKHIKINPRIISATNHSIEEALNTGTLREDFYYRLAVVSFTLPPLRSRPEDIEPIANHYISQFSEHMEKEKPKLSAEARDFLLRYSWPGNARELENVVERAVILADGEIRVEHLGINQGINFNAIDETSLTLHEISAHAAQRAEIELITRILKQTMGNKTKAAQILGVSYKTLLNKVKEYKIEVVHAAL
ncbi:MAG: sigma-54-dependent Fis family transcriptional regulator [Deltaproteobacteria bacterium]|nr:sigma-54-dependent Fis family transcriptional regulator [Deltaproteobacteria bacterium]